MVLQGGSAIATEPVAEAAAVAVAPQMQRASAAPPTTIDALEQEFQRKKKRELEQARMAGGGEAMAAPTQHRSGEKVGRNDPCPCGSGKKYKKCHGIEAQ